MVKKFIIGILLMSPTTQFGMQMPVQKISNTVMYGGGILLGGYLLTRAINHYLNPIIGETIISENLKIIDKKVKFEEVPGYDEFEGELVDISNNTSCGSIRYAIPSKNYPHQNSLVAHIDILRVDYNHRRKGYGSILLKHALRKIKDANCVRKIVYLMAEPHDLPDHESVENMLPKLIQFYERHGARVTKLHTDKAAMQFVIV